MSDKPLNLSGMAAVSALQLSHGHHSLSSLFLMVQTITGHKAYIAFDDDLGFFFFPLGGGFCACHPE